jgi:septal ring factor EnvC (AmiA/AmiB activator)
VLLLAARFVCASAWGEDTPQAKLEAVQKAVEASRQQQIQASQQAASLAAELARLRPQEIAAAQSAQAHEAALTRLDAQMASLAKQQQNASDELARRRAEAAQIVTALIHLARNPPSGVALAEAAPVDALRAGILMSAAVPPLIDRAHVLGIQLKALADLGDQLREAEAQHRSEAAALVNEQARIRDLIALKATLQQKAEQDAAANGQQVLKLAAQARDLKELIERAEAEARRREAEAEARREAEAEARREAEAKAEADAKAKAEKERQERLAAAAAPPPRVERGSGGEVQAAIPAPRMIDPTRPAKIRPFSEAKGRMLYPAAGPIVVSYGATEPAGITSKGITLETREGAQVVAPFDGRVVFAGPFKGYGQILIISHGDGYHSLVAGLDQIDSGVGQWLIAGEPIGVMPSGEAKPRLYLELRHDGQPINPLPWLATRDAKVKG